MTFWETAGGLRLHYELLGTDPEKPTLMLLPGFLGAISSSWRQFANPLLATHRVLRMDFRGHGHSAMEGNHLLPEQLVEDLFDLLDHLAIPAVHLAGHSLGGYVAALAALSQPRRVQTLLLLGTRIFWTAEMVEQMRQQMDPDTLSQSAPTYATQLAQEHGASRWRTLARESIDCIAYIGQNGLTPGSLSRLQLPLLVCVGDRDEVVSLAESARLVRLLPRAGLLVLPHTRHPLSSLELVPLLPVMQQFHHGRG